MSFLTPSHHSPPTYDAAVSMAATHPEKRTDFFNDDSNNPMTTDQKVKEAAAEDIFLDESLRTIPRPIHHPSSYPRLPKLIAIPQIAISSKARPPNPLMHAYAPELSSYGISPTAFMKMIDTINICLGPSPPFQVLQIASMGIGFVPHEWALGVSAGLGVLAGAGTAATCYFRTKRCLEKMREEIWKPRGLRCTLIKDGELLEQLGISEDQAWNLMPQRGTGALAERRLQALSCHIASLDFDVPAPAEQTNILNKLSAKQQARKLSKKEKKSEKKARKRDKKMNSTARKYSRTSEQLEALDATWDSDNSSIDSDVESILSLEDEMWKLDDKEARKEEKAQQKLGCVKSEKKRREYEEKSQERRREYVKERAKLERKLEKRTGGGNKRERKQGKREDKERKKVGSLRWIVIRNWDWEGEGNNMNASS